MGNIHYSSCESIMEGRISWNNYISRMFKWVKYFDNQGVQYFIFSGVIKINKCECIWRVLRQIHIYGSIDYQIHSPRASSVKLV